MGIFSSIGKFFGKLFGFSAPKLLPPPVPVKTTKEKDKSEDDAARRLRLSEKRRRGRRASVLSNIDEEDAKLTNVSRPGASTVAKTFGT